MKSIMTVEEVAEYLGFSVKKIYRLVETHEMPASRIGRQYRFLRETVNRWLEDKNIFAKPDWSQRLDAVLARMKSRAAQTGIQEQDIDQQLRSVRKNKTRKL